MFAIIVLFKICFVYIFAEIISQGSNNSILSTKILVYSQLIGLTTILLAGIEATTIPPPPPKN